MESDPRSPMDAVLRELNDAIHENCRPHVIALDRERWLRVDRAWKAYDKLMESADGK
jgi:hypothetical protein